MTFVAIVYFIFTNIFFKNHMKYQTIKICFFKNQLVINIFFSLKILFINYSQPFGNMLKIAAQIFWGFVSCGYKSMTACTCSFGNIEAKW